jgi:3-oxoacyl-[acyl-carrier protein] reductase
MRLENKVTVVTGAARGIGYAIAKAFLSHGARVVLADIDKDGLANASRILMNEWQNVISRAIDIRDEEQVRILVAETSTQWGRLDVFVNNAGICPITQFEDISEAEWDRVLDINLKGTFWCCKHAAVVMREQSSGKIINIASIAGQIGGISVGVHYSASKAGIIGLTKSMARLLAPTIQVNAVAPCTTESDMTRGWDPAIINNLINQIPAGRLAKPEEVAEAVVFLASADSDFITGQVLGVNGGLVMA